MHTRTPGRRSFWALAASLALLLFGALHPSHAAAQTAGDLLRAPGVGLLSSRGPAPAAALGDRWTPAPSGRSVAERLDALRTVSGRRAAILVTTTADAGAGSLRQAILAANATAGEDQIFFQIPGEGPHRIRPASPLPAITDALTVYGFSQPGSAEGTETSAADLRIVLDGRDAGPTADGLVVLAGESIVAGLSIVGFGDVGVGVYGSAAAGALVFGNYIGVEPDGTTRRGNRIGIQVAAAAGGGDGPRGVVIGGPSDPRFANVVGANGDGIQILDSPDAIVSGNLIGTHLVGGEPVATLGNANNGVAVAFGAADGTLIQGNAIAFNQTGVLVANEATGTKVVGNAIGGNALYGVDVNRLPDQGNAPEETLLTGNYIGVDPRQGAAVPNGVAGVRLIGARNTRVGVALSDPVAEQNVISNNGVAGVAVTGAGAWENRIQNNLIGTDATGTRAAGNGCYGVYILDGAAFTRIGRERQDTERNVIAGNLDSGTFSSPGGMATCAEFAAGVYVSGASSTSVWGNQIGVAATGSPLGNAGYGVLAEAAEVLYVGYYAAAGFDPSNEIAHNGRAGVRIGRDASDTSQLVEVYRNSIHSNGGLGIDLGTEGPTAAPPGSGGPNGSLGSPVLSAATAQADGSLRVEGALDLPAGRAAQLQFYASPEADPSGYGEGLRYLGGYSGATYASGPFSAVLPEPAPDGWVVTATATLADSPYGTSEFSNGVRMTEARGPLTLAVSPTGELRSRPGGEVAFYLLAQDELGDIVEGVTVTLTVYADGVSYPDLTFPLDGDGFYTYSVPETAQPGRFTLGFTASKPESGYTSSTTVVQVVEVEVLDLVLTVSPEGPAALGAGETATYDLRLTDERGAPIADAAVGVYSLFLDGAVTLTTLADGTVSYTFTAPDQAYGEGTLDFQAYKDGYASSSVVSRAVAVEATLRIEAFPEEPLALAPGEAFPYTVYVTDPLNAPVEGATVRVADPFDAAAAELTTDADGRAEHTLRVPGDAAAGGYAVTFDATAAGFRAAASLSRTVTVGASPGPALALDVSPSSTVAPGGTAVFTIAVTDPDGGPVAATVSVDAPFSDGPETVQADAEGRGAVSLTVPAAAEAGAYTVLFVAEADGFGASEVVERTVTVDGVPPTARVQLVHASDGLAALNPLNVFVDGVEVARELRYPVPGSTGGATPFVTLPVGRPLAIRVDLASPPAWYPASAPRTFTLERTIPAAGSYTLTLSGTPAELLGALGIAPGSLPPGRPGELLERFVTVTYRPNPPAARSPGGGVVLYAVHASTDAPSLTLSLAGSGAVLASDLAFGTAGPFVAVAPAPVAIEVRAAATGALLNTFELDLSSKADGDTLQVSLTGFVDPAIVRPEVTVPGLRATAVDESGATEPGRGTATAPEADDVIALAPVRPNPVAGSAEVAFTLARPAVARVEVVDVLGRRVAVLHERETAAGTHRVRLDAGALAPGIYLVRLEADGVSLTQSVTTAR